MDQLTQLLDEKIDNIILGIEREGSGAFTWSELKEVACKAFIQGYNTRIAEEKEEKGLSLPTPGYNREDVLATCNTFIKQGHVDAAVNHYRHATGCDFHTAKLSLGIK